MWIEKEYSIRGRCIQGVKVIGYNVEYLPTGERQILSKEETEKLVLNKMVTNCTGQIYDGKVVLKGTTCKLVDMPNYDLNGNIIEKVKAPTHKKVASLIIKSRIVNGKSIVGYVICDVGNNGIVIEKRVARDKVLLLAKEGKIANARVQMHNNKLLLRGVNCELALLPTEKI